MRALEKAILRTLAYADIFDYPLRKEEIEKFLLSNIEYRISNIEKALAEMPQIFQEEGYYSLKGRKGLAVLRQKRARWSRKKIKIAQRVAHWLKLIPTIKMVAVTGALAMENSNKEDDIDLMIVASKNRLWLARLLTILLIELVADRRRPQDSQVKDKICLNMFLDEAHLALPKKERDLFSAHEVYQMKVLWEKEGIYQKFLKENLWARKFLPNWKPRREHLGGEAGFKPREHLRGGAMARLEMLARKLQLHYMAKRKTTEITEPGRLRFHPQDARNWVLPEYEKRLAELEIS